MAWKNKYYLPVSESGFWEPLRRISHEVAVKMSTKTIVLWRPDYGWWTHFQDGSLPWLLVGGLGSSLAVGGRSLPYGFLLRAHWVSSQHVSWLPQETDREIEKERIRMKPHPFYYLVSEVIYRHFCYTFYSVEMSHFKYSSHSRREELMEGASKNL